AWAIGLQRMRFWPWSLPGQSGPFPLFALIGWLRARGSHFACQTRLVLSFIILSSPQKTLGHPLRVSFLACYSQAVHNQFAKLLLLHTAHPAFMDKGTWQNPFQTLSKQQRPLAKSPPRPPLRPRPIPLAASGASCPPPRNCWPTS